MNTEHNWSLWLKANWFHTERYSLLFSTQPDMYKYNDLFILNKIPDIGECRNFSYCLRFLYINQTQKKEYLQQNNVHLSQNDCRTPKKHMIIKSTINCYGTSSHHPEKLTHDDVINGNIFRVTGPLCGGFTGPGEFPSQRPATRSFDVFFDLRLNKRLSKQPRGWWFETPSWS